MGISLAPDEEKVDDHMGPPPMAKPNTLPGSPTAAPLPAVGNTPAAPSIGLAPAPPAAPGGGPMTPPAMTSSVPAPTVAAPSAPVDRVKLATDIFNQSANSTQGAYDAASRDNIHNSAALGQVGSGGLRTREGDLQLARGRDLDSLRQKLVNDATTGSIADATTAYQQQLAGSQQGLAEKIGLAGIDTQKGSLDLEKEKTAIGANQSQQQIDLAKHQADIDAQYKAGTLTLAERNQKLAELQQQQSFGLETEKLGIAKGAQDIANQVALGQLTIAQATAALDEKVRLGQLTLAEKNQALAELTQKQGNEADQQRIQLAKDQLQQQGEQFGLSLAQTKELATLADKTANRSLDISSAQGKNTLLLELARIMGTKDLSSIDPNFLAAIAKSLGVALPDKVINPVLGGGGGTGGGTGGGGTGGGSGGKA